MTEAIAIERYESLRNGKIGTVVSKTETEVVLDIEGNHKTVKMDNLKRWYKPCGIVEEADVKDANDKAKKVEQLNKRIDKPNADNGDNPPEPDVSAVANKVITYLEKKGCVTCKTASYTRVRLGNKNIKRNIMEVWFGKKLRRLKLVVRSEAIMADKKLYELGVTVPPTHMYTLDHIYKFGADADMSVIYKIIDAVVSFEEAYVPKPHPGAGKRGTGKINGKESLAYKRKNLGIKSDDEKAKEEAENKQEDAVE